jgi:hypothetical protein
VLAAIRGLNRVELAAAAPDWLAGVIGASWQQLYGLRIGTLRLPAVSGRVVCT